LGRPDLTVGIIKLVRQPFVQIIKIICLLSSLGACINDLIIGTISGLGLVLREISFAINGTSLVRCHFLPWIGA